MRHATGTIRGRHNPKRPYRATAAAKLLNHPEMANRPPGAMVSAAPAWPQAALQRFQALEPAPFVPQRLGLDLLEAPKPPTALPRVVAAACALPAAPLVGADAERSQQLALRAPDQIAARARRPRQPLFEREPPRKASRGSWPRHSLMSFARCPFATCAYLFSRCCCAPEFCPSQEKPSQEASPKIPPLKEGRRSAERRTIGPHRQAMRRAPFLLSPLWRTEAQDFIKPWDLNKWSGRARLSAPHRGIRGLSGLGSAQAALPGTTGCKREDPLRHQCSEHLAVRHAPDGTMPKPPASAVYRYAQREPLPLRPKEYPRDKASLCERDGSYVTVIGIKSRAMSLYWGRVVGRITPLAN